MTQLILRSNDAAPIKPLIVSALQAEQNEIKTAILKTKKKLSAFEKEFNLSTEGFLKASPSSLSFDEMTAIEWSGEYETLKRLEYELSRLINIEICS